MHNVNKFAVATGVLASAVADDGTFDVAYPSGYTQTSFTGGMAGSSSYMLVNSNDRYALADPGIALSFGASLITVTNQSGGSLAAGSAFSLNLDLTDGNDVEILTFPVDLASVANGDVVTDFRPGFAGTIEQIDFVVNKPVTTAAKLATLNMEINSTNLTGGVVALTSAAATPQGKVIAGSTITGNNAFTRDDKISIEASSVTAFVEGSGSVLVRVRRTATDTF